MKKLFDLYVEVYSEHAIKLLMAGSFERGYNEAIRDVMEEGL